MALLAATAAGIVRVPTETAAPVATSVLGGVDVRCLAVDPRKPTHVYAGTQGDGVLRSDDAGRTWNPAGLDGVVVKALSVSGGAPGVVYAGTKPPRLYRSADGGTSWEECAGFARMRRPWWWQPAERPHTPYVSTLAASPDEPGVVLAGIEAAKLLRSTNGGDSWTRIGRGVAADAHELAFDPRDGRHAYLAAGFGASISSDSGATWRRIRAGLDRRYGFCLAPAPGRSGSVLLGAALMRSAHTSNARACLYRLDGDAWTKLAGGLPNELEQLPYALVTSTLEPRAVFAGLGDGKIWRSRDAGETWALLPVELDGLRRLAIAG